MLVTFHVPLPDVLNGLVTFHVPVPDVLKWLMSFRVPLPDVLYRHMDFHVSLPDVLKGFVDFHDLAAGAGLWRGQDARVTGRGGWSSSRGVTGSMKSQQRAPMK